MGHDFWDIQYATAVLIKILENMFKYPNPVFKKDFIKTSGFKKKVGPV